LVKILFIDFFGIHGVHKVFGRTDSRTHSRTDTTENRMPPAPKVFGGRGINC